MPILFTCPHCGAQTNVDDRYAGQSGPCAQCGRTITVPLPGAMPGQGGSNKTIIVLAVLGGVFFVLLVCGGLLAAMLLPAVNAAREAARRAQCTNNLRQISVAMMQYEMTHGCLPPAYTVDKQGRRLHSWRMLLLPYLDEKALYDQVRFDEAWDSPHNRALADMMPAVYRCSSNPKGAQRLQEMNETSYVVVVGSHTVFPGKQGRTMADIRDGMSNTILLVEQRAGVNWMEPKDLEFDSMSFRINDASKPAIGSCHPGGANVAFADGHIQRLDNSLDAEVLKLLLMADDGKPVRVPE